jgi:hypothetical protein
MAFLAGPLAGPAGAAAPNLPNPCKLVTVAQLNTMLGKSGAKPAISHQSYQSGTAYEDKICTWTYATSTVTLDVYKKSGGSGGGPITTTPEPSLGPDGVLRQPAQGAIAKFTSVGFVHHKLTVDVYVNRTVKAKRIVALAKHAYDNV